MVKVTIAGDTFFPALANRSHVFALNSDWFISLPWSSHLLLFLGVLTTFSSELSTSTAVKLTSSYCYLLTEESVLIVVKGERMFFRSHTCKQIHVKVSTPISTTHFFTISSGLSLR